MKVKQEYKTGIMTGIASVTGINNWNLLLLLLDRQLITPPLQNLKPI